MKTIGVSFLNDYCAGPGRDRNLYIQSISVNGRVLTPNQLSYITTNRNATESTDGAMYWDGTLTWDASSIPLVNLEFSSSDVIESAGYPLRQPSQPYLFDIAMPPIETPSQIQSWGGIEERHEPNITRSLLHSEPGTNFNVWLDPKVPSFGQNTSAGVPQSLGMIITSSYAEEVKDRIMLDPVIFTYADNILVSSPVMHYLNFNFMLDPSYENPTGWLLHLQAWQGTGFSPPFAIQAVANNDKMAPVQFTFNVRDDALEKQKQGQSKVIYTLPITRGVWYNMVLGLVPSYDGLPRLGNVTMWLNGKQMFSYDGYWGYNPLTQDAENPSYIGIDMGTYRVRQPTTQIIYFNNIRYGNTLESVAGDGVLGDGAANHGGPTGQ